MKSTRIALYTVQDTAMGVVTYPKYMYINMC